MTDPELVSFVIPAHDEIGSLPALLAEVRGAGAAMHRPYEIVLVDDASGDGSAEWLEQERGRDPHLVVVRFARNRGQSAAMAAGIHASRGAVLVTLDADLQNPPADAVPLVAALADADLACGVRVGRKDSFGKRVGSRIANGVRRMILKDRFRDVGCTLKAWRREVGINLPKFRNFHRYIPILAEAQGYRVVEVPVTHRPRAHGKTHYGNLGRALAGLRDLFGVAWLLRRNISCPEVLSPTVRERP